MKIEARYWTHSHNVEKNLQRRAGLWSGTRLWSAAVLLGILTGLLSLGGCEEQASYANTTKPVAETPVEVKAVQPHRGEVYRFINLPGEVRPLYEVTLFAKVNGYLDKLTVDKGDSVKAGELIADIDVPELRANLVKYKAELELAQAEFKQVSETGPSNVA